MSLSSNTLVHLTIKKESLLGILREGFKVKYCYEELHTKNGAILGAFPTVSFSDIPLSELSFHIDSYGKYGIGLKKEWAKRKGLNPVLYFDDNSTLGGIIRKDFEETLKKVLANKLDGKIHDTHATILSYAKNYEGTLNTEKITRKHYRFSDEREWRYVPTQKELKEALPYIVKANYDTPEKRAAVNKTIEHMRLTFEPDDINYLFVEEESEILETIEVIRKENASKPFNSVERLFSRIITTQQLRTDF